MSDTLQYGLKKNVIADIQNIFSKFDDVQEGLIFGSRAKGNYHPGSDIDITLKGDRLNLQRLNKITNNLDDLFLPYIVDLSIYHQINNQKLIDHIKRVGKIFYKRQKG